MMKTIVVVGMLLLTSIRCLAIEEPTYEELIDRLTAMSGSFGVEMAAPGFKVYSDEVAAYLVSQKPELPPRAVEVISDEIALFLHEQMFINPDVKALQYKAYRQHFSRDEILELIAFYETPLGKKLLYSTPLLLQDIQEGFNKTFESVTANLIEHAAPRINKRLKENGW